MVFGIGKKRESWSSRPLSMIIPDNVKLFGKKSRGIMERASHDYSGRMIEQKSPSVNSSAGDSTRSSNIFGGNASPTHESEPITPDTPVYKNSKDSFPKSSQRRRSSLESNHSNIQIPERNPLHGASTAKNHSNNNSSLFFPSIYNSSADLTTHQSSPDDSTGVGKISQDGEKAEQAPFLTLNLDDSKSSLQELSDKLGNLGVSPPTSPVFSSVAPARTSNSKRESVAFIPSKPNHDYPDSSVCQTITIEPEAPAEPEFAASSETLLLYQQMNEDPETNAGDISAASSKKSSESKHSELSSPSSSETESSIKTHDTTEHILKESEADNENLLSKHSYLLNPSVKVMVNHGIYIFDPTDNALSLALPDDESFNPFAYE